LDFYFDNNLRNEKKVFTWLVILSPIFKQYASPISGISLVDLLFIFWLLNVFFLKNLRVNISHTKSLLFFWYVGTILTLLSLIPQVNIVLFDISTRYIRFTFYLFLVILSLSYFSLNYALKYLKVLSVGIAIYIICQSIFYNFFGIMLPFQIGNLPFASGKTFDDNVMLEIAEKYFYRPSGVFIEPGLAVQFLLPCFIFSLFGRNKNEKVDLKSALIIFIAMILSTSSQGILLGVLIILLFLGREFFKNKGMMSIITKLLIIPFTIIALLALSQSTIFKSTIEKVSNESAPGSSTSYRLYRGFEIFSELPLFHKVIGVGHGNLGHFVLENRIVTKYDPVHLTEQMADYANGFSQALLYYGLIGALILIYVYIQLLLSTNHSFRVIAFIQIILSFVAGAIFNISLVFYFSLIYAGYIYKDSDKGSVKIRDS
jgi:O-Antigen ligase